MAVTNYTTLSVLSEALKTEYLDVLTKFINESSGPFLALIDKGNHQMANKDAFTWFMKYGSSAGIKNIAEDGTFGTPGGRKFKQASAAVVNMSGPFAITHKAIHVTKNDKRSIVEALTTQMEDLSNDFRQQMRRQIFGTATGVMGTTKAVTDSVVVGLEDDVNISIFKPGLVIDVLDKTDPTTAKKAGVEIVGIDRDARTLTVSEALTAVEGDLITIEDSYGIEMTGIEDIMTKNTPIYGIDRNNAAYKFLNPFVQALTTSGNADIDLKDFDAMIDDIDDLFGEQVDYIQGQKGPIGNYVEALRRYNVNVETQRFEAGRKVIKYNDISIAKESHAKPNTMDFLTTKHFKLAYVGNKMYDWMDEEGSILKQLGRRPIYEAFLIGYMNLLCFMPSAQGRLTNINEY